MDREARNPDAGESSGSGAVQTPELEGDAVDGTKSGDRPVLPADPDKMVFSSGDWQAIYDHQSGRYYFRNLTTNETTWSNPFEPDNSASTALEASGTGGIDPELAYLDPAARGASGSANPSYTARFNARTGRFEGDPTFDPSRVSEYARGRKQASAYFDVDNWEKSLEASKGRISGTAREIRAREISEGKKLSKAEVARFRERKQEKKAARQRAWLLE